MFLWRKQNKSFIVLVVRHRFSPPPPNPLSADSCSAFVEAACIASGRVWLRSRFGKQFRTEYVWFVVWIGLKKKCMQRGTSWYHVVWAVEHFIIWMKLKSFKLETNILKFSQIPSTTGHRGFPYCHQANCWRTEKNRQKTRSTLLNRLENLLQKHIEQPREKKSLNIYVPIYETTGQGPRRLRKESNLFTQRNIRIAGN